MKLNERFWKYTNLVPDSTPQPLSVDSLDDVNLRTCFERQIAIVLTGEVIDGGCQLKIEELHMD